MRNSRDPCSHSALGWSQGRVNPHPTRGPKKATLTLPGPDRPIGYPRKPSADSWICTIICLKIQESNIGQGHDHIHYMKTSPQGNLPLKPLIPVWICPRRTTRCETTRFPTITIPHLRQIPPIRRNIVPNGWAITTNQKECKSEQNATMKHQ